MSSTVASKSPSKPATKSIKKSTLRKRFATNGSSRRSFESLIDFERDGEVVELPSDNTSVPINQDSAMHRSEFFQRPATSRTARRMDAQDGPWSVSVAESPHDAKSYSLYVKTPTHHLTLTRTASEIHALHNKLRDSYPSLAIPPLPLDANETGATVKRRSSFLHTLSRLASPGPKPRMLPLASPPPKDVPTLAKDNGEDPFVSSPQSVTTGLASYLTALSNDQIIRVSKSWRRFVRVRTDDLESVRVERAIKRVRSDLAKHTTHTAPSLLSMTVSPQPTPSSQMESPPLHDEKMLSPANEEDEVVGEEQTAHPETPENVTESAPQPNPPDSQPEPPHVIEPVNIIEPSPVSLIEGLLDDESTAAAAKLATVTPVITPSPSPVVEARSITAESNQTPSEVSEEPPSTNTSRSPSPEVPQPKAAKKPAPRITRSASADPDKSTRLSHAYNASAMDTTTDDESSKSRKGFGDLPRRSKRKVVIDDFEMMRVLGKGCAGKVLLVKHKASQDMYALKAITKRHVLAHQELQHTLTEQAVLKRMAREGADPFVVKLWWSFHDKENLFLVMDFHPGGDLATQLARWGRLGRDRARFYAAEIVEGVEGLHAAGVIYRDLKPENILIGVDGHIVLTDFGLSKEFPRDSDSLASLPTAPPTPSGSRIEYYSDADTSTPSTPYWMKGDRNSKPWTSPRATDTTSTFCGTAEYLAPEVIQGLPYSYEVDWWSFGTMLFEMLTGITPFWANNHSDMYVRVLQDELQFPEDKSMDQDTRSLIRGLLQRNPVLRIKEPRIKKHPYFSMIDWSHVYHKRYIPPYIPPVEAGNPSDTQNFDDAFLDMDPTLDTDPDPELQTTDSERDRTDDDKTDGEESVKTPALTSSPLLNGIDDVSVDLFDGYSFKGRNSVLIEDDDSVDHHVPNEEDDDEQPAAIVTEPVADIAEEDEPEADGEADDTDVEAKTPEAKPAPLPSVPHHEPELETPTATEPPRTPPPELTHIEDTSASDAGAANETLSPILETESSDTHGTVQSHEVEPVPEIPDVPTQSPVEAPLQQSIPKVPRAKREKSGVPALDRQLPQNAEVEPENDDNTKDEDDDWDMVEATGIEDRNGSRGTTLFQRGVVDRYRLSVFRRASSSRPKKPQRYFSGNSTDADTDLTGAASPTPSEKVRRGRNPGLTFRTPKPFLRAKSPPSTFSASTSANSRASLAQSSATISASSTSMSRTNPSSTSLKSKPSATSVTVPTSTSELSLPPPSTDAGADMNGSSTPQSPRSARPSFTGDDQTGSKMKKIKKNYKEGAEKVFSLFGSPRP